MQFRRGPRGGGTNHGAGEIKDPASRDRQAYPQCERYHLIAKSVERNGADAITVINTLAGIAIDIQTRRPKLGNVVGGLSGPAIKPVAIKMVWDVYKAVRVPIIGMGGVMTWEDAIEFIVAGATAVGVGTALFKNPWVVFEIIDGIGKYMEAKGIACLEEIRGKLDLPGTQIPNPK